MKVSPHFIEEIDTIIMLSYQMRKLEGQRGEVTCQGHQQEVAGKEEPWCLLPSLVAELLHNTLLHPSG